MIKGYVEYLSPSRACGWVLDTENADAKPEVIVEYRGAVIGRIVADNSREDLEKFGINSARGFDLSYNPVCFCDKLEVFVLTQGGRIKLHVINRRGGNLVHTGQEPSAHAMRAELGKYITDLVDAAMQGESRISLRLDNQLALQNMKTRLRDISDRNDVINRLLKIARYDYPAAFTYYGYCSTCNKRSFINFETLFGCSSEGAYCSACGFSSRQRLIWDQLAADWQPGMKVYIPEQTTKFYQFLAGRIGNVTGSEYEMDTCLPDVRIEDVTSLSFNSDEFDVYISNDVFEHVFDYRRAFSEAWRILKRGGRLIFHIPFRYIPKTFVRSRRDESGNIEHLLPPIYHRNPVSESGSLVINEFGIDLPDILMKCGFLEVSASFMYDPLKGYFDTEMLIFNAVKH